MAARIIPADR